MAGCTDCLHVKVCQKTRIMNSAYDYTAKCGDFKDHSRFLELPVLPGDKVFLVFSNLVFSNEREIHEYKVFSMSMMITKNDHWFGINLENQRGAILGDFHFSDIGKTVFLTREEAEKALKEVKNCAKKAKM